jgi:hypothetical protein
LGDLKYLVLGGLVRSGDEWVGGWIPVPEIHSPVGSLSASGMFQRISAHRRFRPPSQQDSTSYIYMHTTNLPVRE